MSDSTDLKEMSLGDIVQQMIVATVNLPNKQYSNSATTDKLAYNQKVRDAYDKKMERFREELSRREKLYLSVKSSE